jgi:hypothetical protein
MQPDNGTPGGRVKLRVDPRAVPILRAEFEIMRDGLRMDLAEYPEGVMDPARNRRVAAELDRLLTQLSYGFTLTGNPDALLAILGDLAAGLDAGNEFERVLAEHAAFHDLLDQLDGEKADHGE